MSFWTLLSKWLANEAERQWKAAISRAIDDAKGYLTGLRPDQVDAAKAELCRKVQDQHKVPGEFRRIACREIQRVDALAVLDLVNKLDNML